MKQYTDGQRREEAAAAAAAVVAAKEAADQVAKDAAAKEAADLAAKEAADLAEQEAADQEERDRREAAVKDIQKSVTKMARGHVNDDLFDGPVLRTVCDPVSGGSLEDLTDRTTTFACLAITTKNDDGTSSGYFYDATMNWDDGSYTYGYRG